MNQFNEAEIVYATDALRKAGAFFHSRGWAPATSGNYSARVGDERVLMTVSGAHKGELESRDFLIVDLDNQVLAKQDDGHKPSAEALLHLQLYRKYPEVKSVLHTHSVCSTALGMSCGGSFVSEGLEMHKALSGFSSHEQRLEVPIVENTQDILGLTQELEPRLPDETYGWPGYLIRGHGVYAWGESVAIAKRHIEGFEFIFEAQAMIRRFNAHQ
jgi:methylthioribulose-1-phosphate dehydratase